MLYTDYIVLSANGDKIDTMVNEHLEKGHVLVGGVSISVLRGDVIYGQAVAKPVQEVLS